MTAKKKVEDVLRAPVLEMKLAKREIVETWKIVFDDETSVWGSDGVEVEDYIMLEKRLVENKEVR